MDTVLKKLVLIYKTDIYLVAAFLVNGGMLEKDRIDRSDNRHIRFCLTVPEDIIERVEKEWYNGTLTGNLKEYSNSIKNLKSILHDF